MSQRTRTITVVATVYKEIQFHPPRQVLVFEPKPRAAYRRFLRKLDIGTKVVVRLVVKP